MKGFNVLKTLLFLVMILLFTVMSTGCSLLFITHKVNEEVIEDKIGDVSGPAVSTDGEIKDDGETELEYKEKIPYINENGDEVVTDDEFVENPDITDDEPFFAEDLIEYEEYDASFINKCLVGEKIEKITEFWGEADFVQTKSDETIYSYFTDFRDIVIHFDKSGVITLVETIDNE
ncbi:MAG: hypothetical protein E7582_04315 [Ruminococcaceae bacterium]|nr:hypothetical protein [Oscillospiraceae bacterium]